MKSKVLTFKFEMPQVNCVDVPTEYWTPVCHVDSKFEVGVVQQLIEYLQRLPDIEFIINSDHQHVRHPFCRELVRNRLHFVKPNNIWHVGEQLSHFLMGFDKRSGIKFKDYSFKSRLISNGQRFQIVNKPTHFETEHQAQLWMAEYLLKTSEDLQFIEE